jgi:tetratricopeptide (TPR) repeat protein
MSADKFSIRDAVKSAQQAEKSGDITRAADLYATVASRFPNHPTAGKKLKKLHKMITGSATLTQDDVNSLVSLLQAGDMENAAAMATRLICIAPKEAVLYNFQGIALSRIFEIERAERAFRAAIKLRPNYSEALGNLGSLLFDQGKWAEAKTILSAALKHNPNLVEANNSMGLTLSELGHNEDALVYLDAAISLNPNYVNAYNSKGLVLKEMGDKDSAIDVFLEGLRIENTNSDILVNLGYCYSETSRETDAIASIEKAIRIKKNVDSDVLVRLAVIYSQIGNYEKAVSNLGAAINEDSTNAEAFRVLSTLKSYNSGDPEIYKMECLFESSIGEPKKQMHLGFALGKAFEDIGEPQKAFQHWEIGNRNRRRQYVYAVEDDRRLFGKVKSVFSQSHFESYQGYKSQSKQPIFVVGMMRSGTTLVEQILSSHSQVSGAGELVYIDQLARKSLFAGSGLPNDLRNFVAGYLESFEIEIEASPRVIDKMPINFLWIGLIKTVFPNAKIINLVRDPRDVGLSIYKNFFHAYGNLYAYDLEELAEFYLLYFEIMEYWKLVLPNAVFNISYEAVVSNIEAEARMMLDYCDLEWESNVLNFENTKRVVKTASLYQVRKKLYTNSINAWKSYEKELEPFTKILDLAGYLPN